MGIAGYRTKPENAGSVSSFDDSGDTKKLSMALHRIALILSITVFAAASALSIKCSADLIMAAGRFPGWFVPAFVVGIAALLSYGLFMMLGLWNQRRSVEWAGGANAVVIWVLIPLLFICTSAVHAFYPFRPVPLSALLSANPVLQLNFGLTAFGLLVSIFCGVLYALGRRQAAVGLLLGLGVLLLIPNDACNNPFNEWWIARLGASPLMFVPNMFAIIFAVAALTGVYKRINTLALAAVGISVALLGLGHMSRVIW
jgi:hypothetical protein